MGLDEMFKNATHFSILDSKDMVNTHRSSSGNDARSFMLKKLKTTKNSKFSQLDRVGSDYSSLKSSMFGNSNKERDTSETKKKKTSEDVENITSEIGNDCHDVGDFIKNYAGRSKHHHKVRSNILC